MTSEEFRASIAEEVPRVGLPAPLTALWWDAKGNWSRAHALVDEPETVDGMSVHAYLTPGVIGSYPEVLIKQKFTVV
ncbi:MAG: hypothetical protein WBQ10_24725 [Terriglobales bacterium]